MISKFTLVDRKMWRTVVMLRHSRRHFGLFFRGVANFVRLPHPAPLRLKPSIQIQTFWHNLYYTKYRCKYYNDFSHKNYWHAIYSVIQ